MECRNLIIELLKGLLIAANAAGGIFVDFNACIVSYIWPKQLCQGGVMQQPLIANTGGLCNLLMAGINSRPAAFHKLCQHRSLGST